MSAILPCRSEADEKDRERGERQETVLPSMTKAIPNCPGYMQLCGLQMLSPNHSNPPGLESDFTLHRQETANASMHVAGWIVAMTAKCDILSVRPLRCLVLTFSFLVADSKLLTNTSFPPQLHHITYIHTHIHTHYSICIDVCTSILFMT